jgi:glycosyltransferase involved in cell wall biosynthesis
MKTIGIGVGGRFHSDFMYQALTSLGYSPQILTSLPKNRFLIPKNDIQNFIWPELVFRAAKNVGLESSGDAFKMKYFGKFLSDYLLKNRPDLFIGWSSFSLETLKSRPAKYHVLMRDSSHIRFQYELLEEEYEKFGHEFLNRSFCLERELEEYELADRIWVLSEFAKSTFVHSGIKSEKIDVLPLGVDLERFKPLNKWVEPSPLRIIYFGIISFRKGVQYLLEATKNFTPQQVELNLIGPIEPEFKSTLSKYSHFNYHKAMSQIDLANEIRKHHVYVFPTLEDGFGQTLVQAMASGLVPITTDNCGSADFTFLKNSIWRVKPRSSEQIQSKIESLIHSPDLLVQLRTQSIAAAREMTWANYNQKIKLLLKPLIP